MGGFRELATVFVCLVIVVVLGTLATLAVGGLMMLVGWW